MQQSLRQERYRQWGNTSNAFPGDLIAAGQAASGLTGLTNNEALIYICRAIAGTSTDSLPDAQAEAAERLNVPGGWDSVGSEMPIAAWDFTSGGSFPGLSFNNPVAGAISRDSLVYVGAGTARSSSFGLLIEWQIANKCTNTNLKPTDTTGTTPDAAWTTHEAVPLSSVPSEILDALPPYSTDRLTHMYHSISNGAGVITIAGTVGNTNVHTPSVWHYTVSGDFGCGLSGAGPSASPTSGKWERFEKSGTPVVGTETMVVGSSQASEVYWFGNQLEENPERSSLIEVSGATVTRLADDVTVDASAITPSAFTVACLYNKYSAQNAFERTFQLDSGTIVGGQIIYHLLRTAPSLRRVSDGILSVDGPSYTIGTDSREAWGVGDGNIRFSENGNYQGEVAAVVPGSYSTGRIGSNAGADFLGGYMKQLAWYDQKATQAFLDQLTG